MRPCREAWEGHAAARPLTGKAAFQAARSRRAPVENWQHWDWQHFHIGNILIDVVSAT